MLNRMGWIGLILLSGLFLSKDRADAIPATVGQAPVSAPAAAPVPVRTPKPLSEAKRSLIRQLLEETGGRQMYELTQRLLITQTQQQIQPMMEQLTNNSSNLSPAEREALTASLSASSTAMLTQFSEALQAEITYDEMLERVYYPVYDQYFTEADLSELIAFYQTPIGKKIIAVSPQIFQTTLELTNQVFTPRITEILGRVMRQRIEQMRETPPTRPAQ